MSINVPPRRAATNPALVEMWRSAIRKARADAPIDRVLASSIIINFDGAGLALAAGMAGIVEIRFPCKLLQCHLFAGTATDGAPIPSASSATVYLGLAVQGAWVNGSTPIYTSVPTLDETPEANLDVTGWIQDYQPGDMIAYSLSTFTGTATFLTVTLTVRRVDVTGIGLSGIASGGDRVVDSSGNTVVSRH